MRVKNTNTEDKSCESDTLFYQHECTQIPDVLHADSLVYHKTPLCWKFPLFRFVKSFIEAIILKHISGILLLFNEKLLRCLLNYYPAMD